MIRLLSSSLPLKTQISTATYLLNHQNKLRHPFRLQLPYFNFSNMKPNQPEPQPENNNDKNKNENNNNKQSINEQNDNQNQPNLQKNKIRMKFGISHPLEKSMKKKLNQNLKQYFRQKSRYKKMEEFKQMKNKLFKGQTFNESENDKNKDKQGKNKGEKQNQKKVQDQQAQLEKQNKKKQQKLKNLLLVLFFLLVFLPSAQKQKINKNSQKKNIDFLLGQIAKAPQKTLVTVKRQDMSEISLTCEIGSIKRYIIKITQQQLVYFLQEVQKIRDGTTQVNFAEKYVKLNNSGKFVSNTLKVLFVGSFVYLLFIVFKKMKQNPMNIGNLLNKEKFKPLKPENITTKFQDVAGMHQAKIQITQFVDFLKKPDRYITMGAKVPKGALLTGPPGTGKTLLAKACAGEAGVPFFSVSGSEFVQKYSGLGASRVRGLFDQAQKVAPSIIFIDQIDAIGKKRDGGPFSNEQRDQTLNQLLVRMDGFDTKNKVIVMAATNRKDMLDPALLRPGRFDRSVEIGLPNVEQRAQILKVHLKKVKFDPSLQMDELAKKIARLTPGFSGAQLANTCNQAAILAARDKLQYIPLQKFEKATQRVMAGLQKRNVFSQQQKQLLSFYEAGKAVANWFTEGADPVIKISILPFSKSKAGYSHNIKDQTALHTKNELLIKVCCYLAGRSAQQHFKGYISTNGNNDLERAKNIITMIVTKFGMTQPLKMWAFPDIEYTRKPYSQKVQSIIDQQINKLTKQCQNKVYQLIKSKQKQILKVQQKLLQKQTLTHNDIKQILGERPFGGNQNYQEFLKDQEEEQQRIPEGPRAGVASG